MAREPSDRAAPRRDRDVVGPAAVVVVFARAPALGAVKTRLARDVGAARALELYRWLGARVVSAVADGAAGPADRGYALTVAFTPEDPAAEALVRAWLPWADAFEPQGDGDLGARMAGAIDRALARGAPRVVLVGTDCAAVDAARVRRALDALARVPCVLGPAHDGGYYLIGADRALPVFADVAWSTDAVAAVTRARLERAGIAREELEAERDVDTADDLVPALARLRDAPRWVRDDPENDPTTGG